MCAAYSPRKFASSMSNLWGALPPPSYVPEDLLGTRNKDMQRDLGNMGRCREISFVHRKNVSWKGITCMGRPCGSLDQRRSQSSMRHIRSRLQRPFEVHVGEQDEEPGGAQPCTVPPQCSVVDGPKHTPPVSTSCVTRANGTWRLHLYGVQMTEQLAQQETLRKAKRTL